MVLLEAQKLQKHIAEHPTSLLSTWGPELCSWRSWEWSGGSAQILCEAVSHLEIVEGWGPHKVINSCAALICVEISTRSDGRKAKYDFNKIRRCKT